MKRSFFDGFDRTNALLAACVWAVTFFVYNLTKAPTLSLWDCGEFIACSTILGLPHPPGSPLFILIGRIFSVLPLADDPAVRVNLVSVVSSSLAVLFGYLCVVRIMRGCLGTDGSIFTRLFTYGAGVSGAFLMAFSLTQWNNSVEAEVYGLAMMLIMAIIWLALIYREHRETALGQRLVVLIFFLAFVGIGVHMTTFLVLPVVGLLFVIRPRAHGAVWFSLATFIVLELYLIFAMSSRPGEVPYYVPVLIVFLFYLFYIFSFEVIRRVYFYVAGGFVVSTAPVLAVGVNALGRRAWGRELLPPEAAGVLEVIGWVGLAGLFVVAWFLLSKYLARSGKQRKGSSHLLMPAVFIGAAVAMVAALYMLKGYPTFLVLSAGLLLLLAVTIRHQVNWPILAALVGVSIVIAGIKLWLVALPITLLAVLILGLGLKMPGWKVALAAVVVSYLGFSLHLFLPIRAAQDPMINESDPSESVQMAFGYLERKQYGSEPMTERMFQRRGEWANQFGDYERMGFWRFFKSQYGLTGGAFVFPFMLGVFGVWEVVRRRTKVGLVLALLILVSSVGLVLYMNFADGTRADQVTTLGRIEVRDRDYFFTPAFIMFGLAIGIGLASAMQFLRESTKGFSPGVRRLLLTACLPAFLLLPGFALAGNYHLADRTDNFIPYDYAWNILNSVDENGVIFTFGDNDTFPVWCVQETYGIRKDVAVVNLSLANLHWYARQVQEYMGVDLGWSEDDFVNLRPRVTSDGRYRGVREQVVDAIIDNHLGKMPITFCVSAGAEGRRYRGQSLDTMITLRGLAWYLRETGGGVEVDVDHSYAFFMNPRQFHLRGINDPAVNQDEASRRITRSYANWILLTADSLRRAGNTERAESLVTYACSAIPQSGEAAEYLGMLLAEQGKADEIRTLMSSTSVGDPEQLKLLLARAERKRGNPDEAVRILSEALAGNPSLTTAFEELLRLHYEVRDYAAIYRLLETWIANHPGDGRARSMLQELRRRIADDTNSMGRDQP